MIINKAHWTSEGDNLRFSMPIGKVDTEKRIVSGFATLDNIDKQGDIVTTEASLEAFRKFRGNLREMHQPNAVGKVVSFKEDRYFDPQTKKFYSGVFVSAYVSKGAQDTWEKVLDGTLTGFSIGGNITKSDDEFNAELDKSIRVIKEYNLFELSLVDSPANQFANVISIEKVNGSNVVGGYLAKAVVQDVFWCNADDIVQVTNEEKADCPSCNKSMKNIGFVEKSDEENAEAIKFLVDSAKGIRTIKMTKEANPMTEDTNTVAESVEEATEVVSDIVTKSDTADIIDSGIAPETTTEEESSVEESADATEEVVGESPKNPSDAQAEHPVNDVKKSEDAVAAAVSDIQDSLKNAFGDLASTVKSLSDQIVDLTKSLNEANSQIASNAKEIADIKGNFNEFGKRVDQVVADTAFRKSGDLGEIVQEPVLQVQKSLWGGRFLKSTDLFN